MLFLILVNKVVQRPSTVVGLSWFEENYSWEVNSGDIISFWHVSWSSLGILPKRFSKLYALSQAKDADVKDLWHNNRNKWSLKPRWPLNSRESSTWQQITDALPISYIDKGRSKRCGL